MSDVGRVRQNNEDALVVSDEKGLFAVADGMGCHAGGEVAVGMAVDGLMQSVDALPSSAYLLDPSVANRQMLLNALGRQVDAIGASIYAMGHADASLRGMGCTLDALLVRGQGLFVAHVGDSRTYALLGGTLYTLTEDHTLGQTLLSSGALSPREVAVHPQRNVLMRALGVYPRVHVDTLYLDLAPGDTIMVCSDGVHGLVDGGVILDAMGQPPDRAAPMLVEAALAAGGRDNATAVVLRVESCETHSAIRVGSAEVRQAMAQASLFAGFSEGELLRVQKVAKGRVVAAGEVVFSEGDLCDQLFLTLDGALTVWAAGHRVGVMGPGDPFGEMSLSPAISPVTVRAEQPSRVLAFPLSEVQQLLASDVSIAAKLAMNSLRRVWQRMSQISAANIRLRNGNA